MKSKAEKLFTAVPRLHNCAQAVAEACGHPELTAELATCGGGRAPEGRCGALHAALCVTASDKHAQIIEQFVALAGAESCRAIKSAAQPYSCLDCVKSAAELVENAQ